MAFLSPRRLPLANNEERKELKINIPEETDQQAESEVANPLRNGQNIFHMKKPTSFLSADPLAISASSSEITTPQWNQLKFVL